MDPFSSEVELIDLHDHFAAGRWQEVVNYDVSSLSPENKLPARILALRAKVTLGEAEEVLLELQGEPEGPEIKAIKAYAEYAVGNTSGALKKAEELAASSGDNATVQVLAGTVLQNEGKTEEALALLSQHQGNCRWSFLLQLLAEADICCSGSCRPHCANTPTTKQDRSRSQGSRGGKEMGAR